MKRKFRITILSTVIILALLAGAFLVYASDYYRADESVKALLQQDPGIRSEGDLVILPASDPGDTALIFYPGAKVEPSAYLPILEKIRESCGVTCILVKMPFNMAIFNVNAADRVIRQFPEIRDWYVGGHSMGGAMASAYATKHPDKIGGLILLGAYLYGDYPASKTLTVYGSFNTSVAEKINYTENVVVIEGGNHAQFGNYGRQKGDPDATITREQQQNAAVDAIRAFLSR